MSFVCTHEVRGSCIDISIRERAITYSNAAQFYESMTAYISNEFTVYLLDFSHLDVIESVGLSRILAFQREVHAKKGKLMLYNMSPAVLKVFQITRLDRGAVTIARTPEDIEKITGMLPS